ncbi:MAG: AmpD protein [Halioglobus sp.]|jgi:AmpD protein
MYALNDGWIAQARKVASPNFGPRPERGETDLLVIHNISLPPGHYHGNCIEQFFCNQLDWEEHPFFREIQGVEVSSHLLIRRDGELVQFVSLDDRAWHAGRSCFDGREECNDYSIGIELEGTDDDVYTERQYQVLAGVTRILLEHYKPLIRSRIVGHSDVSPGRKTDPGPGFDWVYYRSLIGKTGEL